MFAAFRFFALDLVQFLRPVCNGISRKPTSFLVAFGSFSLSIASRLDLADPFLADAEHLAEFLEGMDAAVDEPIAEADDRALAIIQLLQDFR